MKKIKNILRILVVLLFAVTAYTISAQPPPPPGGQDGGGGSQQDKLGGGAPIGGGLFLLLGLGAAYGGRKLYQLRKEGLED